MYLFFLGKWCYLKCKLNENIKRNRGQREMWYKDQSEPKRLQFDDARARLEIYTIDDPVAQPRTPSRINGRMKESLLYMSLEKSISLQL